MNAVFVTENCEVLSSITTHTAPPPPHVLFGTTGTSVAPVAQRLNELLFVRDAEQPLCTEQRRKEPEELKAEMLVTMQELTRRESSPEEESRKEDVGSETLSTEEFETVRRVCAAVWMTGPVLAVILVKTDEVMLQLASPPKESTEGHWWKV